MKACFAFLLLSLGVAHADETQRLVTHFDTVIDELKAADTDRLTPVARAARARLIVALGRYRDARHFPRNADFAEPTPYFVDHTGTRCAMAHLIEISGHPEIVEAVASTRNNAYIRELAEEPALLAWLEVHGLTVAEAARIQPQYECPDHADCHCRLNSASKAIYRARVTQAAPNEETVEIEALLGGAEHARRSVGDSMPTYLAGEAPVGTVLLGWDLGTAFKATHVIEGEMARCRREEADGASNTKTVYEAPGLPTEVVLEAANQGDECHANLVAYDPTLNTPRCQEDSDESCTQRPGDGGSPLLALLLLAAVRLRALRLREPV